MSACDPAVAPIHLLHLFHHCGVVLSILSVLFVRGMSNIYDDTNAAFIYQPADVWTAGTWNGSSVGQSGTLHVANDIAANITFVRPFYPITVQRIMV